MKTVYSISTRKLTQGLLEPALAASLISINEKALLEDEWVQLFSSENPAVAISAPALNETLRPHLEDVDDRSGDLVHAELEESKRLARDIVFDIGDKYIDVLAITVDDGVYESLVRTQDIRDYVRNDPYGGRLLKLSQLACHVINNCGTLTALRYTVPGTALQGWSGTVQ